MKRLGWAVFFLLVLYFIFLIRQDIIDNLDLKKEGARVTRACAGEEQAAVVLNKQLASLQDPGLIEELARTRLGLVGKGEVAYKVIR